MGSLQRVIQMLAVLYMVMMGLTDSPQIQFYQKVHVKEKEAQVFR